MLRGQPAGRLHHAVRIVLVATVYYLGAQVGLWLAVVNEQVTPLWPPTGLGLAGLLLLGWRCWPGISVGAFLANLPIGPTLPVVLGISAGNTAALLVAYLLLTRVGFRIEMDRLRDALALVFLGAFSATLVSATVGATCLLSAGALAPGGFWQAWLVWWAGDAMGVLVVTPVLLVASRMRPGTRVPLQRVLEGAGLAVGIFGVFFVAKRSDTPVFFLAFPLLIWSALRFQHRGAAPCALLLALLATGAAVREQGPFAELDLPRTMVVLLAFNASAALTALLLAAITTQRNEALRAVERAVAQLSDAVAALEPHSLLRDGMLENVLRSRRGGD